MGRPATCMLWFTQSCSRITSLSCLHFFVENTFILRFSRLHTFTKLNSNRDVTIFSNLYPGHFLPKSVSDLSVSWEPWTLLQSSAIWKGGAKPSFSFQDFLKFLKATFVLNRPKTNGTDYCEQVRRSIRTVTVILTSKKFWNQILWIFFWLQEVLEQLLWISLWKPLFSTLVWRIDDLTIYDLGDVFSNPNNEEIYSNVCERFGRSVWPMLIPTRNLVDALL
jgi:hypothetical protein